MWEKVPEFVARVLGWMAYKVAFWDSDAPRRRNRKAWEMRLGWASLTVTLLVCGVYVLHHPEMLAKSRAWYLLVLKTAFSGETSTRKTALEFVVLASLFVLSAAILSTFAVGTVAGMGTKLLRIRR